MEHQNLSRKLDAIRRKVRTVRDSALYSTVCEFLDNDVAWLVDELDRLQRVNSLQEEEASHLIASINDALKRVQTGLHAEAQYEMMKEEIECLIVENNHLKRLLDKAKIERDRSGD